jgi:hypothetical protein
MRFVDQGDERGLTLVQHLQCDGWAEGLLTETHDGNCCSVYIRFIDWRGNYMTILLRGRTSTILSIRARGAWPIPVQIAGAEMRRPD